MEVDINIMKKKKLYDRYHSDRKLERRVINDFDYTHKPLLDTFRSIRGVFDNVLDIGCGTGTVSLYFASRGSSVVGVDISKRAINLARSNAENLGLSRKVKFLVSDFPNGKINGRYDLIVCSELLEHVLNHEKALIAINNLLRKDGYALFSVPLRSSFMYKHGLLNKFEKEVGHLRRYDDTEFINTLKKNNFKIISYKKNQGLIRDYLFTSTTRSFLVALANRFKLFSTTLTFLDKLTFFLGKSNLVVLAMRA